MSGPLDVGVLVLGAGEMASGSALRLHRCGAKVVLTELSAPLCVRRRASFADAVLDGQAIVEGVEAVRVNDRPDIEDARRLGKIPVLVSDTVSAETLGCRVLVDGRMKKGGHGIGLSRAASVIGLGPGFTVGVDCHLAVETNRGSCLGRVIQSGSPAANTGLPSTLGGAGVERVLRAEGDGVFVSERIIGEEVWRGDVIGHVDGAPVRAGIDGLIRGLLRPGTLVKRGTKIGDIDPRTDIDVTLVSDKALAIAGGTLEALLRLVAP